MRPLSSYDWPAICLNLGRHGARRALRGIAVATWWLAATAMVALLLLLLLPASLLNFLAQRCDPERTERLWKTLEN